MGKQSDRKLFLVFAAWTFLAIGVVAAVVTILQIESVGAQSGSGPISSSVGTSRLQLALISGIGAMIALALLLAILWAATRGMRTEYDRLAKLYRSGQEMRSTLDMTGILERIVRNAVDYTGARLGLATLLEEETGDLLLRAGYDSEVGVSNQYSRRIDLWYVRRCVVTRETLYTKKEDIPYERILGHEIGDSRATSILNVPITGREQAIGAITLIFRPNERRPKAADIAVVEEMAAQGGVAIEQVALFTKVRSHAEELELSYDGTLRVLMAALDQKDAVTQGHSERVARQTVALAKEMGVPDSELIDIERGALLHDVGKIGVPDAVLQKPSELDEDEWEAMEKHPLHAGLMVSKVSFLEGAMPIVLYHHERYDGKGYPFKLEREAIPLAARIFSVVDSYDAMTFDRPYRKAIPQEAALAEIERNSGRQFDPNVVNAFVKMIRRMNEASRRRAA